MAEMDAEQNAKKSSWASFQSKVAGKKRTGFVSKKIGVKAKSMFSVGDGGRVGVVGSGSGDDRGERRAEAPRVRQVTTRRRVATFE